MCPYVPWCLLRFPHRKRCSVLIYLEFFVRGFMSFLCCLCLLAHSGVQHILSCVFVLFFLVLYTLCCQFLWIVHFWLPYRYSLTFIFNICLYNRCLPPLIERRVSLMGFSSINIFDKLSLHLRRLVLLNLLIGRHVIASNTYRIIKLIIRKSMLIMSINSPLKKKLKQWWSTIPPISTKPTTTSLLNSLSTKAK